MKKHFNDGTFRGTKHMVKAIALALCFVLLFTSFDTAVFAAEDAEVFESEIELVEESDDIEEQPVEYAETEEVPFEQSITVDDVVITVSADAGVFPEGASMSARKVTISEENEVAEAIDEVRDNDKKVALSYTFDITVCDMNGNEIEPDTEKGSVKVTFKMAEIANLNLETEVYHLEETDGGLNVENLDVKSDEGGADEVAVETTGFSFYTVEFTYNELRYVLEGDEKVELTTILDAVGIKENGEISKVEGSDDELFKPVFEDDIWYIEAVKAFNTEEWLKVTIDGIEFEIVVTDNQAPGEWSKLLTALSGSTPSSVENQFEVSSDEDGIIIKLLADFTAGDGATTLTVSGAKKLDLNGHVINANGKSMRVLTIPSGAELTLEDSDTTASHEGYIDADDIWHLGTGTGTSQAIAGGIITGGKVAGDNSGGISDGGGVLVTGTLKMYGGSISGNTISYTNYGCGGGGIAVADNGIFEMYGGYITYNKAGNGGGVWTYKGTFNMCDDAVISNCKAAASGGGVFVENATFNMSGGVIEKCEAESGKYGNGGGIFTHTNSTFTMTGGAIKNNTAAGNGAGVHNNSGTVTLGGKARITNNMRGTDYNNLYLPSEQTVQISDTSPTTGMSVHVTLEKGTGKVTGTLGTDQYAQYFGSDKLSNGVVAKGGFVQIVSKTNIVASVNHNDQYIYYDSLQNAIDAAGTEDEVQLFQNIQENISVSTDKNITLDLNGKVLKGTGAKSTITVSPGATLTLCDSRADFVHYYKYNSNGAWTWDDSDIDDAITVEEISDSTATGTPIILKGGAITGGSGTVFSGKSYGGGLYNYGTLTMDGGNIVGNSVSWYGGGIYSIGTFELNGGNIVGNYTEVHGAGVYINDTASEFVMSGGQIIYNASKDQAGGVYLQKGNFELIGGSISHNQALNLGGGVICSGTMKMYGGEISFNKAVGTNRFGYGGGLHNVADMYLYDGNISHNSARYGAGIYNGYDEVYGEHYVSPGYLTMTGGTVSENDCSLDGGGLYYRNGDITLGKKAQVSENKKGTGQDASEQNIYLPSGTQIEVADGDDVPTSGMKIGVTLASGTGCFTTETATEECEKYFFADESEKSVVFDPSKKQLQIVNGQAQVHDGIVFIAWTEANSLPNTAGNYYLTEEVTLSSPWTVPVGTINLCLNGHVIKQGKDGNRVIYVPPTATLNIYDCSSKKHYFTRNSESDPWVLAEDQTTPTEFSVEGGVITGGVIKVIESGAGIYVDGTFSMYGGNIAGNNITNSTADKVFGAGVFVQNSGVFNMRGGSIVGNACKANAGGVAVGTNGNPTGKFNMYGGTISDNYAYLWGGGVNNWGTIVMESGTITNNVAKTYGGGGVSNAASFTMTGGTIKDNNACTVGGGVVGDGTVTIGGTAVITNNYVKNLADNLSLGGSMNFASGENVPTTGMNVGINTRKTSYPATISVASNTDYSQYLTSDNDAHCIYYKSSDKMLYLANPATLTIDLNGGIYPEGSSAVADWEYDSTNKTYSKKGSKVILPDAPAAPAFTKFNGWKYNSNLYDAGTEIVFESTENRTYTAEYVNIGSSIKTFATPGELTDPDFFSLWKNAGGTPKGIAQKVYFGDMPWYIVGKDSADGSLVLMSVEGNFGSSEFGSNNTYSTSTIRNYLNTTAMDKFTTAEKALMRGLTSVWGDKLYLGTGDYMQAGVAVGSNSNIYVSMLNTYATQGSPYTSGGWFWLRTPYGADAANTLIGFPGGNPEVGGGIHYWGVTNSLWILPAMNLNLSSVLFASSAPVASASTTFDDGMNFRIVAGNKIGSSAMCTESKVSVTKGEDAGDLYLYVQGKDTTSDWVWSTKITESSSYDVSDIHDGVDLSECVIWLETLNEDDGLAYAKEASATSPYTVTLNNNGGTGGIESVEATLYSDMPEVSTLPTKDGAIFIGYFDEETGGTRYYNADGSSAKKWDKFSDATLYAHWHEHSWTKFAGTGTDSNVFYAVCSEPECEYYGTTEDVTNALSISVNAPSRTLTYDGNDFVASITDTDSKWEQMFEILPDIQYGYKEFGMEAASYSSVPDTKDAGYYKASITVGEKTAYVEYQILKKDFTDSLMLSIDNYEVDGSPNEPVITGKESDGEVTYYYKKKDAADSTYTTTAPTTPWGDYTVKADVAETKNYASASKTCNFQITPKERPETIRVTMFGYDFGQDTAPTPYITPSAGELAEKPTVTYMYSQGGLKPWTGDTSALDAGTYDMVAVIGATDSYDEYTTDAASFTVHKGEWKVTAPTARTLTYNGNAQELVNAGSAEGEQLWYSFDRTNYFENIPAATDSGIYNVYYKVDEDTNHNEYTCDAPIRVTINNADWKVTAPVAKTQTFTGEEQALIDPGTVKDVNGSDVSYKMEYSLTTEDEDFSTDIPKAGNIGPYTVYYRVKGNINYNEYATQSVMAAIVPEAGIWCADIPDQVYTGKAIKPAIDVYSDGTLLKLGTDYTIAYSNNTKAALSTATNAKGKSIAPTVTIIGKGNYKNTKIARTFTIEKYSLGGENSDVSAKIDPTTVAYTKKPIKLSPVVTLNGKKLKMGTDYIVSTTTDVTGEIKNLTDVRKYDLYIVGKGNYSGSIQYTFTITDRVPASKVSIGKIANLKYTGEKVEPNVSITYKKENVKDDFTIEYQNNKEIGTATVIITAKPETKFSGSKSATFKIEGTSIAKAVLGADGKGKIEAPTYSGNPCKPELNLFISDTELTEGKDYTVEYTNNVNAGTATMMVTGKGAYTGTKKFTFKINKYDAGVDAGVGAGGLIKVNNDKPISVNYEKGGVTPKVSVSFGGQILEEKKDYTLSYANNKAVADEDAQNAKGKSIAPTITVTFKGNFSGKKLKTFEIVNKDIEECTLTVADKAYSTKKNAWKQTKITITDVNGKKLAAKTDYDTNVKYYSDPECLNEITEDTLASGTTVYVKANGCNNYSGEVVGQYRISKTNISAVKAVIADQVYTGKEICPTEDMVTVTIKVGKETRTLSAGDPMNPNDGDYTVVPGSYTKNINKGTASLTIRGNGEYFGTKAVKFKIVNKSFEWWEKLNL